MLRRAGRGIASFLRLNRNDHRSEIRGDIQGMRAVAVLLVVLNHSGISFLKGGYIGVDVFFVLSGFLITGQLATLAARRGYASLAEFYARRARRILPAAALTLVTTDIVATLILNFIRAKQVAQDSISASLFVANFHFASQGTNYFFQSQPPSPIQHFWSLAVEEQFYLVWPLLLLIVVLGVRVHRRRRTVVGARRWSAGGRGASKGGLRRLELAIGLIIVSSLAWSIFYTRTHQTEAYFSTFTRAWELGVGAAVALAAERLNQLPQRARLVLGWVGLLAIAGAAVTFSASTEFPGYAAALPVLGTAMLVVAGLDQRQPTLAAGHILDVAPMRFIGDRSYALYLWHWPVLIVAEQYEGHSLPVVTNLLLVAGAFLLSIVSYSLFENPLRRLHWRSPTRALILWPVSVLTLLIVAGIAIGNANQTGTRLASAGAPMFPGYVTGTSRDARPASGATGHNPDVSPAVPQAEAHVESAVASAVALAKRKVAIPGELQPSVATLLTDRYSYPAGCGAEDGQSRANVCRLGDSGASRTLVLMGDSHAQMWMPDILAFAQRYGYDVRPIGKSACIPGEWWGVDKPTADCRAWYRWATHEITTLHPAVTILAGDYDGLAGYAGAATQGIQSLISKVRSSSGRVLVLADQPPETQQPTDCLLKPRATMQSCSMSPTPNQIDLTNAMSAATAAAGGRFIPTAQWFCAENVCPMVIGHTIVYFDPGHITTAFADTLEPAFVQTIEDAVKDSGR